MPTVACFCGHLYSFDSFDGGEDACPRCGEIIVITTGIREISATTAIRQVSVDRPAPGTDQPPVPPWPAPGELRHATARKDGYLAPVK